MAWGIATVFFTRGMRDKDIDPAMTALFKNTLGLLIITALLVLLQFFVPLRWPSFADVQWLWVSGVASMALGDFLYFIALAHIGVGRTLILNQFTPVLTALAALVLFGEKLTPLQWTGAAVVVLGGIVAESRRLERARTDFIGLIAITTAVLLYTAGNLMSRQGLEEVDPFVGGTWRLFGGFCGMVILLLLQGNGRTIVRVWKHRDLWKSFWLPTLIGTVGGIIFLCAGIKWAKQGVASALAAALPLFSIPLAVLILGERPGWRGWLGAILVVIGVALIGLGVESAPTTSAGG